MRAWGGGKPRTGRSAATVRSKTNVLPVAENVLKAGFASLRTITVQLGEENPLSNAAKIMETGERKAASYSFQVQHIILAKSQDYT